MNKQDNKIVFYMYKFYKKYKQRNQWDKDRMDKNIEINAIFRISNETGSAHMKNKK